MECCSGCCLWSATTLSLLLISPEVEASTRRRKATDLWRLFCTSSFVASTRGTGSASSTEVTLASPTRALPGSSTSPSFYRSPSSSWSARPWSGQYSSSWTNSADISTRNENRKGWIRCGGCISWNALTWWKPSAMQSRIPPQGRMNSWGSWSAAIGWRSRPTGVESRFEGRRNRTSRSIVDSVAVQRLQGLRKSAYLASNSRHRSNNNNITANNNNIIISHNSRISIWGASSRVTFKTGLFTPTSDSVPDCLDALGEMCPYCSTNNSDATQRLIYGHTNTDATQQLIYGHSNFKWRIRWKDNLVLPRLIVICNASRLNCTENTEVRLVDQVLTWRTLL